MPSINDPKNADHQRKSRNRRARCYMFVKQLALQSGHMAHLRDMGGLDRFLDDHPADGDNIDWFEAVDDLQ